MQTGMLEILDLSVGYGAVEVLQNVTLRVAPGEVVGLIGPNGAGKTTLVRAASGVLRINKGSVRLAGQDVRDLSQQDRARLLAVVPQARLRGGAFSVEQTVLLGRTPYLGWLGRAGTKDWEAVHQAMQQTGIAHLSARRNADLSGGEQQRVLLARALAQETQVLLLDEPTTHLDLAHQAEFLSLVRELARDRGKAVLMALHDLNHVSLYADRVALLVQGRLTAAGPPEDILTAETLAAAYGTSIRIIPDPQRGNPIVLLDP